MAIEIRPTGEAGAVAQAGAEVGKAKKRETQRKEAQRAAEMDFRRQSQQAAREWDLQKMLLNSQQDFAHEQRMTQVKLDTEARSKEWEVEKMELRSRFDFEQEEKERVRRKATYIAGKESIDNNEGLTDEQKSAAHFYLSSKYTDISEAAAGLGMKPQTGKQGLFNLGLDTGAGLTPEGTPGPTVDNPLGLNIENIPVDQLSQAVLSSEQQNKFEVISPDGEAETIDADQWPDYKAQGYILASIQRQQRRAEISRELKKPPVSFETFGPFGGF